MRILVSSHSFHPSVGGLETVSDILAREFLSAGHEVNVITQTPSSDGEQLPFAVHRRPSAQGLLRMVRWCEVVWHNGISLRTAWPLCIVRRPWVITHMINGGKNEAGPWGGVKRSLTRFATNIAVSRTMLPRLPEGTCVIGNPFDDDLFGKPCSGARTRELVFLGRLVPEKGLDLLLEALLVLERKRIYPALTIIGIGPEEQRCRRIASDLKCHSRITFVGAKRGAELAQWLNAHQILVVPSRCREAFGVVALEGIACGCAIIGSDGGGLPEAIGPCGVTFPNNDVTRLATCVESLVTDPSAAERCRTQAQLHLAKFSKRAVAERYLQVFKKAMT